MTEPPSETHLNPITMPISDQVAEAIHWHLYCIHQPAVRSKLNLSYAQEVKHRFVKLPLMSSEGSNHGIFDKMRVSLCICFMLSLQVLACSAVTSCLCFSGTVKYTFEGPDMVERSHRLVINAMTMAAAKRRPVDGIKGPSAVAKLRSMDLVWGFPPDYLHCVLEGVVAQLLELWLSSTGKRWYIGNRIKELDARILKIRPHISFTRLPRPLSERSFWKATEWKFWLLYYGVPCLQNLLPERYLKHFALLSQSVFMLLKTTVEESEIILAETLLKRFVEEMATLYGENQATFNVHQLVHLAKSVRMTGPLWVTSTFPFEGGNGEILKLVSAAKGVPQQIAERYIMHEVLKSLTRIVHLSPVLKHQQELISGKRPVQHHSSVLGAALPPPVLENCIQALINNMVGPVSSVSEYFRARIKGIVVHSAQYRRTGKTCSEYVEASDGKLYRVLRVFTVGSSILLLCQELIFVESSMPFLYEVDHPPANVGLCLLREENVLSPCVFVEQTDRSFLVKIPNLYEKD